MVDFAVVHRDSDAPLQAWRKIVESGAFNNFAALTRAFNAIDKKIAKELATHFAAISKHVPLHPVRTAAEYEQAVQSLNALLDAGAADENHPLAGRFSVPVAAFVETVPATA